MQMLRAILSKIINRKRMSHERRLNVVLGVRVRGEFIGMRYCAAFRMVSYFSFPMRAASVPG